MSDDLVERWKHWAEIARIPPGALHRWAANPGRQYHCVDCGRHGSSRDFSIEGRPTCPTCGEFQSIEPCISEHCDVLEGEERL